ncbi:MAG: response regulator [Elusimicrobiales bacterium]|nr:response regulator [Elusimicrobiales bacterium]
MLFGRNVVLVADDDREFAEELQEALAGSGYIPVIVGEEEIMSAAREITPDLILLDVKLGKADGRAIAAKIRANPRLSDIPVILMSGYFGGAGRRLETGPATIRLGKPFSQKDVVTAINGMLADRNEQAKNRVQTAGTVCAD